MGFDVQEDEIDDPSEQTAVDNRGKHLLGRKSREQGMREANPEHRDTYSYEQPLNLPHIEPRPGYRQRWVEVSNREGPNTKNWSRKLREGWLPRQAETIPQSMLLERITTGMFQGAVVIGDAVLMEKPEKVGAYRDQYFASRNKMIEEAIDGGGKKIQDGNTSIERGAKRRVLTGKDIPR